MSSNYMFFTSLEFIGSCINLHVNVKYSMECTRSLFLMLLGNACSYILRSYPLTLFACFCSLPEAFAVPETLDAPDIKQFATHFVNDRIPVSWILLQALFIC